ncbi:MAG: type II toxin-antitoxin system VapC family toxin [Halobacteria archaeon]
MIGADTSFLIDFFNGDEEAITLMDKHKDVLYLCENVVYEFLCGNLTRDERKTFLGFVNQFPVFGFDRESSLAAAELHRKSRKEGRQVPHPDGMIAGTYIAHGIGELITGNPGQFREIKDLEVITYRE